MSEQRDDDAQDRSAFEGDTPPHVDPEDPKPEIGDDALDTGALGEGGPAGA